MSRDRSKFAEQMGATIEDDKTRGSGYGYLALPKGIRLFKVEGGDKVSLDFLPYIISDPNHPDRNDKKDKALPGYEWYRRPFKIHRQIGVDNTTVVCPMCIDKKCPICEYRSKLVKQGKPYDDPEVSALRASDRNLYVVVPIGNKDYEEDIHIFDFSHANFEKKLLAELQEKPQYRIFFDPTQDGYTVDVRFSAEKFGKTKYADTDRIDFNTRKYEYDDQYLADVPDLDKVLIIYGYDKLNNLFFEIDDDDKDKESLSETHDTPRSSRSKRDAEPEPPARESRSRRAEKDDEPPARESRSRRSEKEEEPEPRSRSRRNAEPEPEVEQPRSRSRRDAEPDGEPEPRSRSRRDAEPEPETRSRSRRDAEPEKETRRSREVDDEKPGRRNKDEDTDITCIACEGSGEDSKGRSCPICKGSGKGSVPSEKDVEPPASRRSTKAEAAVGDSECPYGHKFGIDCEGKGITECDTCKVWEKCYDKKKELKRAAAR